MKIPRSGEETQRRFRSLVPKDESITVRPMFGNMSAFVNGNLFIGLYGDRFLFRLPPEDVKELVAKEGAAPFEPMKGRVMKGYVLAPEKWARDPKTLKKWMSRSLLLGRSLPPKTKRR